MESTARQRIQSNIFIIVSILLHILLFCGSSFILFFPTSQIEEKKPALYIPSYVYDPQNLPKINNASQKATKVAETTTTDPDDILGLKKLKIAEQEEKLTPQKFSPATKSKPVEPPVHLIGDKFIDDPLRKILGQAITARLIYPSIARELYLRGIAAIGFTLYPNGEVTNVYLAKSSGEKILDNAALSAVSQISPVNNVDLYLKAPKKMVVNIIF